MTPSKTLTPQAAAMFAYIEKYLDAKAQNGLTQKSFCAQEGLALTTFQNWLQKYRRQQHADQTPAPANRFIPLNPLAPSTAPLLSCVLEFPNGVQLRVTGNVDLEQLLHLAAGR